MYSASYLFICQPESKHTPISQLNSDQLKKKAEEILNETPPEVQQAVQKSKSFYQENKPLVGMLILCVVVYKIEKRMVRKVVTQVFQSEMENGSFQVMLDQPVIDTKELAFAILEAASSLRNVRQ